MIDDLEAADARETCVPDKLGWVTLAIAPLVFLGMWSDWWITWVFSSSWAPPVWLLFVLATPVLLARMILLSYPKRPQL